MIEIESPKISKYFLKNRSPEYLARLGKIAEEHEAERHQIITAINELGRLVNGALWNGGYAYIIDKETGMTDFLDRVEDEADLFILGLLAYHTLREKSERELIYEEGNGEERWYPSHIYKREEIDK